MVLCQCYLALPCMLIGAFEMEASAEKVHGFLWVLAASVAVHALNFAVGHALLRDPDDGRKRVLVVCAVFSNCGFMGYPLQTALLGTIGVFYGSAFVTVFTLSSWTYGLIQMSGGKQRISAKTILLRLTRWRVKTLISRASLHTKAP